MSMLRHRLVALLVVLCAVAPLQAEETPQPRGEKITLQLNLKKGDEKKLNYKMDMTSSATVQGQQFDVAIKMGMYMGAKVEEVDGEGLHTVKMSYDRISMDMASPFFAMAYDSKEPEKAGQNPAFAIFGAMIGKPITMKMTRQGETKEVTGLDELAKSIAESSPAGAGVKQQLESLKSSFEQFAIYPDKPVDIGDSWTRKMKMTTDPNMPMDMEATYTLVDRKEGIAIIKMKGTMTATNGAMKGTTNGTLHMAEATGWIAKGETDIEMSGEQQGAKVTVKGKANVSDK